MTDQPDSPLAGLSLDAAMYLRCCAISRASDFMGVSPDDLGTLTKPGLIEVRGEIPVLTKEPALWS